MRVLQLIDSLDAGGAERVAVNMANTLSKKIDKSFLCATRKEGLLKASISNRETVNFWQSESTVFDVFNILQQCEVGVLSSKSEGLPMALLEYGLAHLAVITTDVGECSSVVLNAQNGLLINPLSVDELSESLILYLENKSLRNTYSAQFKAHVIKEFSEASQLKYILDIYNSAVK